MRGGASPVTTAVSRLKRKATDMVPYEYKAIHLNVPIFTTAKRAVEKIDGAIQDYASRGWELYNYHPVQTMLVWKWNVLIFRRSKGDVQ